MITTGALNYMLGSVEAYATGNRKLVGLSSTNTVLTTYGTVTFDSASSGIKAIADDVVLQANSGGTISKLRLVADVGGGNYAPLVTVDISPTITVANGQYVTVLASGTNITLANPS